MVKDVRIVVPKSKCNNPSSAQWTTGYDMTIHNLCMQEMIKTTWEMCMHDKGKL